MKSIVKAALRVGIVVALGSALSGCIPLFGPFGPGGGPGGGGGPHYHDRH